MIYYESNKNFFGDMGHLTRSWTMRKVLRASGAIGLYCLLVCIVVYWFDLKFELPANLFSLIGIVLSILLVFRTNTAYDRWWEGRNQWGALVNHCRNLATMAHATFPSEDKNLRKEFATGIANFCIALKDHLRAGVKKEELLLLTDQTRAQLETRNHIPAYFSSQLHIQIQTLYRSGVISDSDLLNFKPHLQALLDITGACERIRKTPIPFSYAVYVKVLVFAYILMLPFGMVPDFGFMSIPIVMFLGFTFIGIEMMAQEIEEPFGLDCNDLPTSDIAHTIKSNVFEILEVTHKHVEEEKTELYEKIH
ncbi:MAG: bestrophin family protein [Saprospirales bacterium]|nr:bestrophin family protein [Saprospirales bacterium]